MAGAFPISEHSQHGWATQPSTPANRLTLHSIGIVSTADVPALNLYHRLREVRWMDVCANY
jgi:hypothetical protein